jgi:hypothetical protein
VAAAVSRGRRVVAARLAWPLPALVAWGGAWCTHFAMRTIGFETTLAALAAFGLGLACMRLERASWRRVAIAGGFPLSFALSGVAGALPAWAWLAPLAVLLLAYPIGAWRDAPIFPTPPAALDGLARAVPLAPGARVLDAGCGLGHALRALRRQFPRAELHGVEHSVVLRLLCAWRCPGTRVTRDDMWRCDWSTYDLVYLFQRPETLPRALEKARREMRAGTWLASLEFEAPGVAVTRRLAGADGRSLWLYRLP